MWADFPIFGGYNKSEDPRFAAEDCVNLFLSPNPGGKKKFAYLNTPGLQEESVIIADSSAESRALFAFEELMYGVFGETVYTFDSALVDTEVGTIGTDTGYVSIAANNGGQVGFADGEAFYIYNIGGGTFTEIMDAPPQPLNVAFLDGYFVIPSGESRTFQISALNDGTQWDPLDSAQIQAYPGVNMGVGVVNRRLYFFKTDSTEVWYNQGAADFPFRRDNNLIFNFGCLATASIVSEFGYLFWLAQDKSGSASVMMTSGTVPVSISNDSIDSLIQSFEDPTDVRAYAYKDGDHIFYVLNWTTDDYTFVYNVNMGEAKIWHRMEMLPSIVNEAVPYSGKQRFLANCHAYFNYTHYVGSYKAPILYSMSRNYPTNNGEPIKRMRQNKSFFDKDGYRMMQIDEMQLDMETGIGSVSGEYQDPQVFLSISKDGAHVFGNEAPARIGRIGQRRTRAMWRKKGQARDLVTRMTVYAPVVPIAWLGASIKYQVLPK